MARALPDLTLFLGPETRHGLAINNAVREHRPKLAEHGLSAYPTRIATPAVRRAGDPGLAFVDRSAAFRGLRGDFASFWSAMNVLGDLPRSFKGPDLFLASGFAFPEEAATDRRVRVVLTPDSLPDVFAGAGSAQLDAQVRETPWEALYDLSWVELVRDLRASLPVAEMLILTHAGTGRHAPQVAARLFGGAASVVGARGLLRPLLTTTGQAVLDRMGADAEPDAAMCVELYDSFADRADAASLRERMGLDRLTARLLRQRFDEDLDAIAALPGIEVI